VGWKDPPGVCLSKALPNCGCIRIQSPAKSSPSGPDPPGRDARGHQRAYDSFAGNAPASAKPQLSVASHRPTLERKYDSLPSSSPASIVSAHVLKARAGG
jgi:hypothetical protein